MAIKQNEIITASDVVEELSKKLNTDDLVSNLLNKIYPVGSIYISINNVSPASFLGGSWSQLPEGYALWTCSSEAGETINAGLPNIKGEAQIDGNGGVLLNGGTTSGALGGNDNKKQPGSGGWTSSFPGVPITFNASTGQIYTVTADDGTKTEHYTTEDEYTSYTIFGKSNTVQPPAYKVYAWKRTA